jgi:hypothetical protein
VVLLMHEKSSYVRGDVAIIEKKVMQLSLFDGVVRINVFTGSYAQLVTVRLSIQHMVLPHC